MTSEPLTNRQLAALGHVANAWGVRWRMHVRNVLWLGGNIPTPLDKSEAWLIVYALRNTHGPRWLARFKFPAMAPASADERKGDA